MRGMGVALMTSTWTPVSPLFWMAARWPVSYTHLVQEQGDGWAVIGPMPVEEMHQLAKEKEAAGIPVFFAGLAQEA